MTKALREQAEALAAQPFRVTTFEDELSDETGSVWIAMHPELEGSIAQGETEAEAIENLHEVRVEYILSLLRRGFDVPRPSEEAKNSVSRQSTPHPTIGH